MKQDDCIFCKLVAGEIPAQKICEDDEFVAFLDIRPLSAGHALVIPKEHYRFVWDVPQEKIGAYFQMVQKVAKAQQEAFGVEEIHAKVIGEEVPHAHVWVFPHPGRSEGDKQDLAGNAAKLRAAIL